MDHPLGALKNALSNRCDARRLIWLPVWLAAGCTSGTDVPPPASPGVQIDVLDEEVEAAQRLVDISDQAYAKAVRDAKTDPAVFMWTSSSASLVWTWQVMSWRLETAVDGTRHTEFWTLHRVAGGAGRETLTEDVDGRLCPPVHEAGAIVGDLGVMLGLPQPQAYDERSMPPVGPGPDGSTYRFWARGSFATIDLQTYGGPIEQWHEELTMKLRQCGAGKLRALSK